MASSIIAMRSSTSNMPVLLGLVSTATITSSNCAAARSKTSMCPSVTGSNEPGQTAPLMRDHATANVQPLRKTAREIAGAARSAVTTPDPDLIAAELGRFEAGVAVAPRRPRRPAGRPVQLWRRRRPLDHDHAARTHPAMAAQATSRSATAFGRHVVGRIGEHQIHRRRRRGCQHRGHRPTTHRRAGQADGGDIAVNDVGRRAGRSRPGAPRRPPGQRLEPQGTGTRVEVQHPQSVEVQAGGQDVEQRLAHAIGGRPRRRRARPADARRPRPRRSGSRP